MTWSWQTMLTACAYCDELHCICPHDDDADLAEHAAELAFAALHEEDK